MMNMDDNKKIGMGLFGIGVTCLTLGVFFLFDRRLMSLGNIAFLVGFVFLLGADRSFKFFFRKEKSAATACFFIGIFLTLYGYSFIGFLVQMFGVWKLFASFLPNVVQTLRYVPGVSTAMEYPPFSWGVQVIQDNRRLPL